jgi:hypothetical protein
VVRRDENVVESPVGKSPDDGVVRRDVNVVESSFGESPGDPGRGDPCDRPRWDECNRGEYKIRPYKNFVGSSVGKSPGDPCDRPLWDECNRGEYKIRPYENVVGSSVGKSPGDGVDRRDENFVGLSVGKFPDDGADHSRPCGTLPGTVGRVIRAFKSITTHAYTDGVKRHHWPPFTGRLWLRNYYEHIVRTEKSFYRIREYIVNNPAQWEMDRHNPFGWAWNAAPPPKDESWLR